MAALLGKSQASGESLRALLRQTLLTLDEFRCHLWLRPSEDVFLDFGRYQFLRIVDVVLPAHLFDEGHGISLFHRGRQIGKGSIFSRLAVERILARLKQLASSGEKSILAVSPVP